MCYLVARDKDNYNLRLVQSGWAIPYFIYPNAVSATEEGEWEYDTIRIMQDAAVKAREENLGVWSHIHGTLIPMELRFLIRRELPSKYCAGLKNMFFTFEFRDLKERLEEGEDGICLGTLFIALLLVGGLTCLKK